MTAILIADDNPADLELLLLAMSESDILATVHTVNDGVEAMQALQYLHPDLIMLDVRMPRMGGLDVLEAVRGRSDLRDIPVIVMSSSRAEQDSSRALALGALRYWHKGSVFPDTLALVRTLPELVPALGVPRPGAGPATAGRVHRPPSDPNASCESMS